MRISDWSSDVCSSDLRNLLGVDAAGVDGGIDQVGRPRRQHDRGTCRGVLRPIIAIALIDDRLRADPHDRISDIDLVPIHRQAETREPMRAVDAPGCPGKIGRAHSELQSLMRISYAVFCLKKKNTTV